MGFGLSLLSSQEGVEMHMFFVKHIVVCYVQLLHMLWVSLCPSSRLSVSLFAVLPSSLLQQVPGNFSMCR